MIFDRYDAGIPIPAIRQELIRGGYEQKGQATTRHRWSPALIYRMLRSEAYAGQAVWRFGDGSEYSIEVPPIVTRAVWERCQRRLNRNKLLSTRKAKGVYLLQGLAYCGECGRMLNVGATRYPKRRLADGTMGRVAPYHDFRYRCRGAPRFPEENHPRPCSFSGVPKDAQVWRYISDNVIKRPDVIHDQVLRRQAILQEEGDSASGDIASARRRLAEIGQERANYQRQEARGKITEAEFDARMAETAEAKEDWESELSRLKELRDDQDKVTAGLDYTRRLLAALAEALPKIDHSPNELRALPKATRRHVLEQRRSIVRSLVDRVRLYSDGRVTIEGVLDGGEVLPFALQEP